MKIKLILIITLCIGTSYWCSAQDTIKQEIAQTEEYLFPWEHTIDTRYPQFNNNIGFTASYFSGAGIHYKRFLTPDHAIKAVFWGWLSNNRNGYYVENETYSLFFNFGLEYQYHFLRKKQFDFYALVGYRLTYDDESNTYWNNFSYNNYKDIETTNSIGIGVGSEIRIGRHFVINADVGFASRWISQRGYDINNREILFGFIGGIGLGFVF